MKTNFCGFKTGQRRRTEITGDQFDPNAWLFIGLIAIIAAINFLWPRHFLFFSIHHLSYLPTWGAVSLTIMAVLLIIRIGLRRPFLVRGRWPLIMTATLCIISFMVFRTEFPSVHGDGEAGGPPRSGKPSIETYSGIDGRLQSFLAYGFTRLIPAQWNLYYQPSVLASRTAPEYRHRNSAWILLTILIGMGIVVVITDVIIGSSLSTPAKVGLQWTILTAEPMLNAYGHFDSYIVPMACVLGWLGVILWISRQPQPSAWHAYAALAVMLGLSVWAHPLLLILLPYSLLMVVLLILPRFQFTLPLWLCWLAAVGLGLSPLLIGRGNLDWFKPPQAQMITWLVHEKFMSCLQVSLPAWVLAIMVLCRHQPILKSSRPIHVLAVVMLISTALLFFTLWVGYGLGDELLYSLLGMAVLGAAIFLFLTTQNDHRVILYVGILSIFLFIPKMCVYSNREIMNRFYQNLIFDRCAAHQSLSPYCVFSTKIPMETGEWRDFKLACLRDGALSPLPMWLKHQDFTRATYAAWCFEFDEIKNGWPPPEVWTVFDVD